MTTRVLWFLLGAAAGGAAALYLLCPTLCERGVKGAASGFLTGKVGLPAGLANDLASYL